MIWLAWRQFRTRRYVFGLLAVVAVVLAVTGPIAGATPTTRLSTSCQVNHDCDAVMSTFTGSGQTPQDLSTALVAFPALLGMFWGAPLVAREMESGTFRLAWTQSVTRRRWILTRLVLVGTASAVAAGLFSLMVTWWMSPIDRVNYFPFASFDHRDLVPAGYALFAVMLGVALGALFRRTLPAMAVTLFGYVGFGLFVTNWVRPRFESPIRLTSAFHLPFTSGGGIKVGGGLRPGDWIVSSVVVNPKGQTVLANNNIGFQHFASGKTEFVGVGMCPNTIPQVPATRGSGTPPAMAHALNECVASFHLRDVMTYQPGSRFWMFQWEELALYVVLAVLLGAFSYWWVRRRLS